MGWVRSIANEDMDWGRRSIVELPCPCVGTASETVLPFVAMAYIIEVVEVRRNWDSIAALLRYQKGKVLPGEGFSLCIFLRNLGQTVQLYARTSFYP